MALQVQKLNIHVWKSALHEVVDSVNLFHGVICLLVTVLEEEGSDNSLIMFHSLGSLSCALA